MASEPRLAGGSRLAGELAALEELLRDRELLIVSNRQPYRHSDDGNGVSVDQPTGGLTAGLDPVMQATGGTWIAWGDGERDSDVVDGRDCVDVPPDDPRYRLRRIWLSDPEVRGYYVSYCNQVLWPLCHGALTRIRSGVSSWQRYRQVNERFAAAVVEQTSGRPLVWFQDYHLGLAPAFARSEMPAGALLMHFWHIPWPAWDTYRASPHRQALLRGLLANDLLVFHVPRYRHNFLECVDAAVDTASIDWDAGTVTRDGHVTAVTSLPMGVTVDRFADAASGPRASSLWRAFRRRHDIAVDTRIGIGVDRLDYTKGIVERLRALQRLWETHPGHRESFTFVQIGSESRSRIPAYRAVQERVADEVERINRQFGTDDWTPIVYMTHRLETDELCSLYANADLGIVSPIRDGLNLVAQEYVAAQTDRSGVLVLSDQAGIHDVLGEDAVTITPTDIEGFAVALADALAMSSGERNHRMAALRRQVIEHDLRAWLESNFRAAAEIDQW